MSCAKKANHTCYWVNLSEQSLAANLPMNYCFLMCAFLKWLNLHIRAILMMMCLPPCRCDMIFVFSYLLNYIGLNYIVFDRHPFHGQLAMSDVKLRIAQ